MHYTLKNKLNNQLSMAPLTDIAGNVIRLQAKGLKGSEVQIDEKAHSNEMIERLTKLGWVDVSISSTAVDAAPHPVIVKTTELVMPPDTIKVTVTQVETKVEAPIITDSMPTEFVVETEAPIEPAVAKRGRKTSNP